jgi:hypothetical protein
VTSKSMTDSVIGDCCFASNSTQLTSFKPLWMITAQAAIGSVRICVFNYLIPVIFYRPSAALETLTQNVCNTY